MAISYIFWFLVEANVYEFLALFGIVPSQLGRVVFGNEEQDSHGVHLGVGGLPLGQLDGRDAQGPDICLGIIQRLLDHFRGHPEGGSNKCITF